MVMPRSRSIAFESITRVDDLLVFAESAGLAQELVDQRGLAMVDVGDDGDVANGAFLSAPAAALCTKPTKPKAHFWEPKIIARAG
jgi:hypothetical protein